MPNISASWTLKAGTDKLMLILRTEARQLSLRETGCIHFVMPFGLTSAPATFQRLMDTVLQGLLWQKAMVYLDDIIVYNRTWEEHVVALDQVFGRLKAACRHQAASVLWPKASCST